MDAEGLILLVDIIDAGSLSVAARRLNMTRANMSYRLRQLETAVGMQLLRRTTRRIEPTEIGLQLYAHGRNIRDEVLAAVESVDRLGKSLHGSVRMSLPTGFGEMVMADWLIEFKRRYPDIVLDLHFSNRVDNLMREEIDVAVRVMSDPPEPLIAVDLAEVRYVVCAASDYGVNNPLPLSLEDLHSTPLITSKVEGRDQRLTAYRENERRELPLRATLASENFGFLREAVLAGIGVGLMPEYVVKSDIDSGRITTLFHDWRLSIYGTRMVLLRMPGRYQTLASRTLIDFVIEKARTWADLTGQSSPPHSAITQDC